MIIELGKLQQMGILMGNKQHRVAGTSIVYWDGVPGGTCAWWLSTWGGGYGGDGDCE